MALSAANAVSPTPAVDNTVRGNTSIAGSGNGNGGTFTDNLEAVLTPQSADGKQGAGNDNGTANTPFGHHALAKLKNKLKNGDLAAAAALTPQQLQQQQAFIKKLSANNTGIDIPALRGAMGKGNHIAGQQHILPALNPLNGKISQANAPSDPTAFDAAVNAAANPQDATANVAEATTATVPQAQAAAPNVDPSKGAAHAATQKKLVAALAKTAQAPVLKDGAADGSKVPNAKIAHPHAPTQKAAANSTPAADGETVQALAAKIAATAGATNAADTAQTAAKGVAVAEVASRKTQAAPTVTKIETAAITNATQTATHAPTPQAKIEAQALPVQFDAQPSDAKSDGNGTQSGADGKSQAQTGSARTAGEAPQQANTPDTNFASAQPSTPAHANTTTASTTTATDANAAIPAPISTAHVATTLQVSQQPQHSAAPDQTTLADLGIAIAARSKDGEKQFDINMHPADLGKIDVRISVGPDGQAQAHLTAEHPQTLQLLKQDQSTLAQNLRDAGLNLANSGLNFSLKGEQQPSTPTFNARSRALSITAVQTPDVISTNSSANIAPGDSRLDIRV
ncbi:MAG TPA: flagellar hook-length control protein FliK [Rhizomicrobium sp.]